MKTVSVLVVTRHRDAFLLEALRSLRLQTHAAWEAVVVDNGASERTRDVVLGFGDRRLSYVRASRNLGECAGRNLALRRSRGGLVCYLDDDDLLPPDSIACRLRFLEAHPACGMVHGEYRRFRMDGDRRVELEPGAGPRWRTKSYYDPLLERLGYAREETFYFLKRFNFVRGGTPLVRRAVFDAVGGFDEALANHGDYEMWLRIASRFPIRFLPRVVYLYRAHEGSTQERTPAVVTARCAERICRRYGIAETLQFGTRAGPPGERSGTRYEGGLHGQEGRR